MKKNQVCIIGCGWLGKPLALKLKSEFLNVTGTTTSVNSKNEIETSEINHVQLDLNNFTTEQIEKIKSSDVFVLCIPASKIQLSKLQHLIEVLALNSNQKILLISSTSVYNNAKNEIEESDFSVVNQTSHQYQIEQIIQTTPNHLILRMAGLIGPGRHPAKFMKSSKVLSSPDGKINFITQSDATEIIRLFSINERRNEIFNCTGDEHFSKKDFYSELASTYNLEPPQFSVSSDNGFKVISNKKIKSQLNFSFTPLLPYLSQLVFE